MKASAIVSKIRRTGDIRLGPGDRIQTKKCSPDLRELVRQSECLVGAWLREERASKKWEASGRNPEWWRTDQGDFRG
jgi:hypothetical protein